MRSRAGPGTFPAPTSKRVGGAFRREIQGATINIYDAPPVDGLGNAGGFKMMIKDVGNQGWTNCKKHQPGRRRGQRQDD